MNSVNLGQALLLLLAFSLTVSAVYELIAYLFDRYKNRADDHDTGHEE